MQRKGNAIWNGGLKDGTGLVSTESGALLDKPYSFSARFENGAGTNPEELLAAAHAGCFSMALSGQLSSANLTATQIRTQATVTLEKAADGFRITKVHLDVEASVPGATAPQFDTLANAAKAGCPVSRLFNAEISMTAKLIG